MVAATSATSMADAVGAENVARRRGWLHRLAPLPSGPREIRALDGWRAVAALSVVAFHLISTSQIQQVAPGLNSSVAWNYLRSGVHLFFVLSGFLLFMPYARAILTGQPLPSVRGFYRRRALRILPAYWVCLAVMVLLNLSAYASPEGLLNVGLHTLLLHNFDPATDMGIQGVFWTMAVEAQFYLVLPLVAWALARFAAPRRSLVRLLVGIVALALGCVAVREASGVLADHYAVFSGHAPAWVMPLLVVMEGAQGHFLAVFAAGMFCGTLYVAAENGLLRVGNRARAWLGVGLFAAGLALAGALAEAIARPNYHTAITNTCYACINPQDWKMAAGPLLVGASYAAMVLGALWGASWLRAAFELASLRFVGLISYSLYLWHLPVIQGTLGLAPGWTGWQRLLLGLGVVLGGALPLAFLSYTLVERPFLKLRHRPAHQGGSLLSVVLRVPRFSSFAPVTRVLRDPRGPWRQHPPSGRGGAGWS